MGSAVPTFQVVDNPHSFVNGSIYRVSHLFFVCCEFFTLALPPLITGNGRWVVHGEHGCNKWKNTLACLLLVLPRSQAKIVQCEGRYDPQRSSE